MCGLSVINKRRRPMREREGAWIGKQVEKEDFIA